MSDEIVRGDGHAPGQSAGEAMPSVANPAERASASDFERVMREKNEAANARAQGRQPAPTQSAKGRMGEFSERLERSQEAPTDPTQPRDKPGERDEREPPEQNQLAEPDGEQKPENEPEQGEQEEQEEQSAQSKLDDAAALQKFREWEQSDLVPPEMGDKLDELKINGRTYYYTYNEMKQMAMRGGDYRRLSDEIRVEREQIQGQRKSWDEHFQAIKDPEAMLEIYERNGYGETLEKMAYLIGERIDQMRSIVQAAGIAAMQKYGTQDWNDSRVQDQMKRTYAGLKASRDADIRLRRAGFTEQQAQQKAQAIESQQNVAQLKTHYTKQIEQLRPAALRAYGIPNTVAFHQRFAESLRTVINTGNFDGNLTRQMVMDAAADLRDKLDDEKGGGQQGGRPMTPQEWRAMKVSGNAANQRVRNNGLPPQRMGGGAGNPMGNTNGKPRGSVRDLEKMVMENRMRGR